MADSTLQVEVAYADTTRQQTIKLTVPAGCNVETAIKLSGMLNQFPEIDLTQQAIGIFGKRVELLTTLQAGDRIEIYRPLLLDPKQLRHLKAKIQRKNKA